jgi:hypothetical protein
VGRLKVQVEAKFEDGTKAETEIARSCNPEGQEEDGWPGCGPRREHAIFAAGREEVLMSGVLSMVAIRFTLRRRHCRRPPDSILSPTSGMSGHGGRSQMRSTSRSRVGAEGDARAIETPMLDPAVPAEFRRRAITKAMAELCAERGYTETSITDVAAWAAKASTERMRQSEGDPDRTDRGVEGIRCRYP